MRPANQNGSIPATIPLPPPPAIAPAVSEAPSELGPLTLSGRERDVLAWFALGQSSAYIGARLGISPKTVQTYRARLLDKLHLMNTTDLIRYAVEHQVDMPVTAQPTPPLVIAPIAMHQMIPAPVPITYRPYSFEREEWPG